MYSATTTLDQLSSNTDFISRHIGSSQEQQSTMLEALGYSSMDAFIAECIPDSILAKTPFAIGDSTTEYQALAELQEMANKNQQTHYMIGTGYAPTLLPPVLQRNVVENPSWYTAYTPYQAEISQGRLQLLLNFQQMVVELTGLDVANASLLDEATAAAEAVMLAHRAKPKKKGSVVLIDQDYHPQTFAVIATRCAPIGIECRCVDMTQGTGKIDDVFALVVHYPGSSGHIRDYRQLFSTARKNNICCITATDPLALVLLESPGALGADIAVGTTQRFGVPLGFGGPHAGYIACADAYKRHLPGRIIGLSKDANDRPALRMALQTREQHIRREKATSNICTAQALLANLSVLYAQYHGIHGLQRIAWRVHRLARILAAGCQTSGLKIHHKHFFDTLRIETGADTDRLWRTALEAGLCLRKEDGALLISCSEATSTTHVEQLLFALTGKQHDYQQLETSVSAHALPETVRRQEAALQHTIFTKSYTETDMMRYLKSLEDKDIGLNRSMIPLGSCTMKLNAAAEMMPITWPGFTEIHPFAPQELHTGYSELFRSFEQQLCAITGFSRISLQPNSGAQGEYAGLMAIRNYHIRNYHRGKDDTTRNTCLIPASSHGTNPASAHMAGMVVVVVASDKYGNVDVDDLQDKATQHQNTLAALMITYPSTHGVFEEKILQVCDIIHKNGGLVYMDGANMNAMVGIVKPAELGADVMHLNLHKTFCIPHGGGGPGAGPIGVNETLAEYLPGHPQQPGSQATTVSAAPWGSALILPVSWAYIRMMGSEGLRKASHSALLNANYLASRLKNYFSILYSARSGLVAHECIIDIRPLKQSSGISEEDIAKRLIDFGFHSPTMSFPVSGTLMIEPTESESIEEIHRFTDALIHIRQEIVRVEQGEWPLEDNPLVNAPHTAKHIAVQDWLHPYSRDEACFPLPWVQQWKYWPPVQRVDNVYGDKHFCACLPIEEVDSTV